MANFRSGSLNQGDPLGKSVRTVALTVNNQLVQLQNCSRIDLTSDTATATNRTLVLEGSTIDGYELELCLISGSSTSCQLANSGNAKLSTAWLPLQYDTIFLAWNNNASAWIEISRAHSGRIEDVPLASGHILVGNASNLAADVALSGDATMANTGAITIAAGAVTGAKMAALTSGNILVGNGSNVATSVALSGDVTVSNAGVAAVAGNISNYTASIPLTQAQILALNGTPVSLIAAPGAGKLIVVDEVEVLHTYSTAAYANGGKLQIQYHGSTDIMDLAVGVVTGSSSKTYFARPNAYDVDNSTGSTPVNLDAQANLGVDLTNATAVFINGNAANVIKLRLKYRVITLLT